MDYLQYGEYNELYILKGVEVLNLVINGLPSIHKCKLVCGVCITGFKPCYKWITFNTNELVNANNGHTSVLVLNLVINGLPSIPFVQVFYHPNLYLCFKPCYKWITFNTYN